MIRSIGCRNLLQVADLFPAVCDPAYLVSEGGIWCVYQGGDRLLPGANCLACEVDAVALGHDAKNDVLAKPGLGSEVGIAVTVVAGMNG
ncbi:MAG: hypothetical protein F6K65_35580 [Moorea sp. SIO3C2]|nr:hypothetical protein [Moorena sp. SIO3C2]